jgi:hypothetical protein
VNFGTWPSLNLYAVRPPSELQKLNLVRERLAGAGLDAALIRDADRYLRLLEEKPELLKKLMTFHAGRHRESRDLEMAFHYLAIYRLRGRGGSASARTEVAALWSKSEVTIRDAHTDNRGSAEYLLGELVTHFVGRSRGGRRMADGTFQANPVWTERTVLEAICADMKARSRMR